MRKALYGLFSQYGTVLDIVAQKSLKLRGQAFVIFRDIGSASTALKALQSFAFYDKPMVRAPPPANPIQSIHFAATRRLWHNQ